MPIRRFPKNNGYYPSSFNYYSQRNKVDWNSLLNNTQRTLSIINSAIPIFHQARPIVRNASTMFKIYQEMNRSEARESSTEPISQSTNSTNTNRESSNRPTFFL